MSGVSFGDLRSLTQREPSKPVWATLCAMIESWPDPRERDELASPYVLKQLDLRWPDELRVLPGRWIYEHSAHDPHYLTWPRALSLGQREVRALNDGTLEWPQEFPWEVITRARIQVGSHPLRHIAPLYEGKLFEDLDALSFSTLRPRTHAFLAPLLEEGTLEGLSELELMAPGIHPDVANLALDHPSLSSLRALSFTRTGGTPIQQELGGDALAHRVVASRLAPHLTSLGLRFVRLTDLGACVLAENPMPALERLNLEGNPLSRGGLDAILSSSWGRRGVAVSTRGCPALDPDVDLLTQAAFYGDT